MRIRLILMGEQRCGTTLLNDLLHVQAQISSRSGFLSRLFHATCWLGVEAETPLDRRARHVLAQHARSEAELPADFEIGAFSTLHELHGQLLDAVAAPDEVVTGHKIHGPVELLPSFARCPDVRVVFILRDIRDAMLSRWYRGESFLDQAIFDWKRSSQVANALRNEPRFLAIRFEDLIQDPTGSCHRLGQLLQVAVRPEALIERFRRDARSMQNSSFAPTEQAFDPKTLARYRQEKQHPLVRYSEWIAQNELARWSYEPPTSPPTARERLHFERRRRTYQAISTGRRAKHWLYRRLLPPLAEQGL